VRGRWISIKSEAYLKSELAQRIGKMRIESFIKRRKNIKES